MISVVSPPAAAVANVLVSHYDRVARDLVEAHAALEDEPLVLAVRYRSGDPKNLYLLEVVENFPGLDEDPLFENEFAPNAELRILGTLHLALGNPAQMRHAAAGGSTVVAAVRRKRGRDVEVLYAATKPVSRKRTAKELRVLLGL